MFASLLTRLSSLTPSFVLRGSMEALVLLACCLSPWAFGAVDPVFEFLLYAIVALLLLLWAVRVLVDGQLNWKHCPLALCLAGLFVFGIWQMTPLPHSFLRVLSPATSRLYGELLPAQHETLTLTEPASSEVRITGSTLSLYPGGTRQELIRLLAVLLLYLVVRNNLVSTAALQRFCIAALLNGSALALFGIIQYFSSPPSTVYFNYPTAGRVFGPFICSNHFAFYVNICIGLSLGLLLSLQVGSEGRRRRQHSPHSEHRRRPHSQWLLARLARYLDDVRLWWIGAGIALMVCSIALTLSRGGLLTLCGIGGVFICASLNRHRSARLLTVLLIIPLALALLIWLGLDPVQTRLETLTTSEAFENRLPLWLNVLPLSRSFPLWGTGYGTFFYVEPLTRHGGESPYLFDHAHNEYLEALIEGGIIRLAISLTAIVLVFRLGLRAIRRSSDRATSALTLGALFGFSTLVIHSMGDFGLHIPSIAFLATVLCAFLTGIGDEAKAKASEASEETTSSFTLMTARFRPLRWAMAAIMMLLGLVLYNEGAKASRVQGLVSAWRLSKPSDLSAQKERASALEAVAGLMPDSAPLQLELAQVHLHIYEQELQNQKLPLLLDVTEAVLAWVPTGAPGGAHPALSAGVTWQGVAAAQQDYLNTQEIPVIRAHLVPALAHYLQARDLCPLLSEPHLALASHLSQLQQADARTAYLARTKRLQPTDARLWLICGIHELGIGTQDAAWQSWRRSLELSPRYRAVILANAAVHLKPADIVAKVMPDDPVLLDQAAREQYPDPKAKEARKPFFEKALAILDERGVSSNPRELHLRATLYEDLDRPQEALKAYSEALLAARNESGWRLEYARLLVEQKQWDEARDQLRRLRNADDTGEVEKLLKEVEKASAANVKGP